MGKNTSMSPGTRNVNAAAREGRNTHVDTCINEYPKGINDRTPRYDTIAIFVFGRLKWGPKTT